MPANDIEFYIADLEERRNNLEIELAESTEEIKRLRARLAALESAAKEVERDLRELHRVCAVSPVIVDSADRLRDALTSEASDGQEQT